MSDSKATARRRLLRYAAPRKMNISDKVVSGVTHKHTGAPSGEEEPPSLLVVEKHLPDATVVRHAKHNTRSLYIKTRLGAGWQCTPTRNIPCFRTPNKQQTTCSF